MKLINVTIDGNTASTAGGGIYTENVGGGTAVTRIANTIVSNNSGQNCVNSNPPGNNVNSIVGNLTFPGSTCTSDVPITSGDPKLDAPTINLPDILTLTMSLQAGSAALRAGDNATCAAFPVLNLDQRSLVAPIRPLPGGTNCDAGAYESSRAPGYGSAPAPGSTINIVALTGSLATSNVVISETGDDDLKINDYSVAPNPLIIVSGPAFPFTIADGAGTQTLTLGCNTAVPGSASTTLTVNHNATGSPATYTVNCVVVDPLVITTVSPLAAGTVTVPYSLTFAATGGTLPYVNWQVTAGSLPPGLTLNPGTGQLSGTPTLAGPVQLHGQRHRLHAVLPAHDEQAVHDHDQSGAHAADHHHGHAAGCWFHGSPYPPVDVRRHRRHAALHELGGHGRRVAAGPHARSGHGTAHRHADHTGSVQLLGDGHGFDAATGTKAFTMTVIDPPSITTATPLPTGEATIPYVPLTFAATSGTPPYGNWQVIAGALPPGLSLAPGTGQLTGTPTTPGPYSFTIQTTDATPLNASKAFTMTINPLPTITTATPLPGGTVSTPYSVTFAATGGTLPYTNWAVTAGSLPGGLTLNAGTGQLSGTPTTAAPNSFSITVTDSLGGTNTKAFTLLVSAAPVPPTITTATPLPRAPPGRRTSASPSPRAEARRRTPTGR
jgi:predicted outer membrane repeat protein